MTNCVRTENLDKIYGSQAMPVNALRSVNLQVEKGELLALVGPSGSGKTTLLNMIGALDQPSAGKVFIEDTEITHLSSSALAMIRLERIGFVFQEFNLIPVLSALENVEYVMLLQGVGESSRKDRALAVLQEVGLGGLEDRRPAQLSGGQQQRVAVARAIVTEPAIVLADEPTANLDSATGASLLELMQRLNQEKQITFILSTHDPMVMDSARRVQQIRNGELVNAS